MVRDSTSRAVGSPEPFPLGRLEASAALDKTGVTSPACGAAAASPKLTG